MRGRRPIGQEQNNPKSGAATTILQRNGDAFAPGGQFDPLLDRLEIDDDAMLVPHRQDPSSSPYSRICRGRHIGALKVRDMLQIVDLSDRPDLGYAYTAYLQTLDGKRVAFTMGIQGTVAPIDANPHSNRGRRDRERPRGSWSLGDRGGYQPKANNHEQGRQTGTREVHHTVLLAETIDIRIVTQLLRSLEPHGSSSHPRTEEV